MMLNRGMESFFLKTIVVCLMAGAAFGEEILPFDKIEFGPPVVAGGNRAQVRLEAPGSGSAPLLSWGTPSPAFVKVETASEKPSFSYFQRMTFRVKLEFPEKMGMTRIGLRFMDRTGETFNFLRELSGQNLQGPVTLDFPINGDARQMFSWGGNGNGIIDWPLRFLGLAFYFDKTTPPDGRIQLDALEAPFKGDPVKVSLDTGNRQNLLLPGYQSSPSLTLRNLGEKPIELSGSLTVSDFNGNRRTDAVSRKIAPGAEERVSVPGDYSKQGCWKLCSRLKTPDGREFSEEHRFARMNPAGPTVGRPDGFLFGLCGHPERFSLEEADREAVAAGLCGAKILRLEASWKMIQPRRDVWDFKLYDQLVKQFNANGVELEILFSADAPWAVSPAYRQKVANAHASGGNKIPALSLFSEFVSAFASRYRGRVRYYEIWNEPDLVAFANYPAKEYMKLLHSGYNAVKKADPNAKVMNGGIATVRTNTSDNPLHNRGVLDLLLADGGKHFDVFAFHGHGPFSDYVNQLNRLDEYGLTTPGKSWEWYANETAVSSVGNREKMQGEVLFKKLLFSWAHGAIGYNWYLLREKSYYPPGHPERHYGLVTAEFEPKPGYVVYNMLANTYRGGRFLRTLPVEEGVYALQFQDNAGRGLTALWSTLGDRLLLASGIPQGTVRVDLYGNETPVRTSGGLALLKLSGEPFTLKTAGMLQGEFRLDELFPHGMPEPEIFDGGIVCDLSLPIMNPTGSTAEVSLEIKAPEGIGVSPAEQKMKLPPHEIRKFPFQIHCKEDSRKLSADSLRFHLKFNGLSADFSRKLRHRTREGTYLFLLDDPNRYHSLVPYAPGNESLYQQGPGDLSAEIRLSEKDDTLHLEAKVTDDRHVQPAHGADVWKGDGLQFVLYLPEQNRLWKFGLTRLTDGRSEVFCWEYPAGNRNPAPEIKLVTRRDEKRKLTIYEADIPLPALGLTRETMDKGCRFNLVVNDNDGSGRKGFLAISPGFGYSGNERELYWPIVRFQ